MCVCVCVCSIFFPPPQGLCISWGIHAKTARVRSRVDQQKTSSWGRRGCEYLSTLVLVIANLIADYLFSHLTNLLHPKVLRFVGVVDVVNEKGEVKLRRYKKDHPFAQLSGSDNIIAFTTTRYMEQPLIVRGPGAGAQVTAAGVFSDILRLASYLGAPS